jgi:TonB family protein
MFALPQAWVPWVEALGWALLHFVWQAVVVGALFFVLRPLCRSVTSRYRLGLAMLVLLAACPVATAIWYWPAAHATGAARALPAAAVAAAQVLLQSDQWRIEALLPWLVGAWLIGVLGIASRAFLHWRQLNWLVRHAATLPECQDSLAKLCRRFGINRPVRLLASLRVTTPMLVGWLRPVILLPASLVTGFSPTQIELIIAHELGHIRRWDYLANLFQVVIETVLFYHPVVHWICRDVRNARESCCDDLVLALGDGSPVAYARTLAELETLRHDVGIVAPALGAGGGVLLARIRRIVGLERDTYDPLPQDNRLLVVAGVAAAAVMATLRMHSVSIPPVVLPTLTQSLAVIIDNPTLASPKLSVPSIAVDSAPVVEPQATTPVIESPRIRVAAPFAKTDPVLDVTAVALGVSEVAPAQETASVADAPVAVAGAAVPPPIATHLVQPRYPPRELAAGETGTVVLEFGIAADGRVRDIRVSGKRSIAFDDVAIAALREWRFSTESPIDTAQRYTQAFAFTRASGICHEVIGSHICRHLPE